MRTLTPNQTYDPARGSFIVRAHFVRDFGPDRPVFVAPTEPNRDGSYETFSNAIQFIPVKERAK